MTNRKVKRFVCAFAVPLLAAGLITHANALDLIQEISPEKSSTQESNFYSLSLEQFQIPNAKSLLTAVSGDRIFIGDRPSRTLYEAKFSGDQLILEGGVTIPNPTVQEHPSNALLDLLATKTSLFVALVDGAKDFPVCGSAKIYEYLLSDLAKKPKLIFKSTPCVQGELFWDARLAVNSDTLFIAGGNSLVKYDDGTFPGPDSMNFVEGMKFPKTNYFGAVSAINLQNKKVTVMATGLRHLGGLFWDQERKVLWESENGPRGGDELNIIKSLKNYGWPQVTLGRPYDFEKPSSSGLKTNSVGKSEAPVYGWTPSISPSSIRKIPRSGEFSQYWSSDLIVGSLKGNELRRLRITKDNHVMYDEPIPIGDRIRALDVLKDGRLILATDTGRIILISNAKNSLTGRYPKDPPPPSQ
jgi:hypothetical protein